ncbi:hypothetical protein AB685_08365 [Bacillus sp. LL01]|uniref:hypothetical protein n=1 Tax=Bacillus sp. LL01 TaxID=1665556 RepID=UPI00064D4B21|nr:hypothetical protein [Bacillus sp. LL01]KMJ59069.1 hypothetical protein AB685_08365 [Bacillus sp. LL01]
MFLVTFIAWYLGSLDTGEGVGVRLGGRVYSSGVVSNGMYLLCLENIYGAFENIPGVSARIFAEWKIFFPVRKVNSLKGV